MLAAISVKAVSFSRVSRVCIVLLFCLPLFAQRFTVGVIGGVPVTNTFDTGGLHAGGVTAKTIRYTVGPTVDFRLIGPLRFQIDALYQPFSFRTYNAIGIPSFSHTYGDLWQFSELLKFRLFVPVLKPFVEVGPSVQLASNVTNSSNFVQATPMILHADAQAVAGFSAGAPFEFALHPLIIAPEVRYTRWFDENFNPFNTPERGSHLNQVEVLLSIRL
jgi:hypothetical protein